MAGVWDNNLKRFVFSTTNFGQSGNLNARLYGDSNIHVSFETTVTNLTPNTDYRLYLTNVLTNNNYFGNNQGWNDCCLEEDIQSFDFYGGSVSDNRRIDFTSDVNGNAIVTLTPTTVLLHWVWSTQGLNFYDGESAGAGDQMTFALYNTGFKGAVGPNGSNGVAVWDSIQKYNSTAGYNIHDARFFTFFNRFTEYTLKVYSSSGSFVDGFVTKVRAETPFAYQVGGGDYPQNPDTDYTQPQSTLPVPIDGSPKETEVFIGIDAGVSRVVAPYNKTTEREVVHLDNRLKSTE